MDYGLKLSAISLQEFKEILKTSYLIPSMRVLLNDIDKNFEALIDFGISNVNELYLNTKTKKKAELLSNETHIDADYIIVLRRMVLSYIPKPRALEEYPDIDPELLDALIGMNIKNSIQLFDHMVETERKEAIKKLNIKEETYACIWSLMNVSRLRYVSPLFSTVMVRSGYDSIRKIARSKSKKLHEDILATNKEQHIYEGNIGDSDMQFLIDDANVFLKYNESKKNM